MIKTINQSEYGSLFFLYITDITREKMKKYLGKYFLLKNKNPPNLNIIADANGTTRLKEHTVMNDRQIWMIQLGTHHGISWVC
jgi:hypothetical protein